MRPEKRWVLRAFLKAVRLVVFIKNFVPFSPQTLHYICFISLLQIVWFVASDLKATVYSFKMDFEERLS